MRMFHWTKTYIPTPLRIYWVCIGNVINLAGFNTFPIPTQHIPSGLGVYVLV